jgi:type VI secretion system secreted protein VgrG
VEGKKKMSRFLAAIATLVLTGGISLAFHSDSPPPVVFQVSPPLGQDVLLVQSFTGTEALSQLFRFEMEFLSENLSIDLRVPFQQSITVGLDLSNGQTRFVNGFVSRFEQAGLLPGGNRALYRVEIVPWLWFLTRTSDSRIFQEKSVPDILQQIFEEHGFPDFTFQLQGQYPNRDFTVQYRETDFNFVSRLMEEEGIYYFFRHEDGRHTMVLADSAGAHQPFPGFEQIPYTGPGSIVPQAFLGSIFGWSHRYGFISGKFAQTDYNFETPSANLLTTATSAVDLPRIQNFELYEYPGGYGDITRGQSLAQIRTQEEDLRHNTVSGAADARGLAAGFTFTLTDHPQPGENRAYLITSVQHQVQPDPTTGNFVYHNSFTCIPDSVPFRPTRVTPKPVITGAQTAVVVGPAGEEIFTDQFGRVKVQFHWDREGKKDENSSGWIRVAHPWAGKGWGIVHIPRIGQEAVITFEEGDPDRPLILGRVYNAEDLPPAPF